MGLKVIPMADTGPIGGDLSHEFIILLKQEKVKSIQIKIFLKLILININ